MEWSSWRARITINTDEYPCSESTTYCFLWIYDMLPLEFAPLESLCGPKFWSFSEQNKHVIYWRCFWPVWVLKTKLFAVLCKCAFLKPFPSLPSEQNCQNTLIEPSCRWMRRPSLWIWNLFLIDFGSEQTTFFLGEMSFPSWLKGERPGTRTLAA